MEPIDPTPAPDPASDEAVIARLNEGRAKLLAELGRVIVGQDQVVRELLMVIFSGGHCVITGAPGLAKTLLIRSIARLLDLDFRRIQFTPDLMPSDITGTEIIEEDRVAGRRELRFIPGPIFTNILLADEINRTPPKTQAALLEAMEEKQVTVAGMMRPLPRPFFVLATQNPIELEGTYPLPEAQLDRFMMNIQIGYLSENDELAVATRTTAASAEELHPVLTGEDIVAFASLARRVPIADPIARYAVQLAQATRPSHAKAPQFVRDWVGWGAGTRASQNLILAAKTRALLEGRHHASIEDIRAVAAPVLRHRVLTNFRAEADHITSDAVIEKLLATVDAPKSGL